MNKILPILFLTLLGWNVHAQKQKINYLTTFDDKRIHFGFSLGINYLDFNVESYQTIGANPKLDTEELQKYAIPLNTAITSDVSVLIPGFTVGIISNLRLSEDFDLRFQPGLSFGERKLYYNLDVYDIYIRDVLPYYSIKSTFLDFPVSIKYKARRINNDRPYILFGTAFRQDISKTAQEDLVKLTHSGFYAEVGAGWDHYFTFFRFSVEAKVSLGLNNQLGGIPGGTSQRTYYSQSIKSLKSNIFTLSIHFE